MDTSSAPPRGANHEEAVRALEEGTRYLDMHEYERAFRLLRRSFTLEASPAAAAAISRVRTEVATDARYCATCVRYRANCVCGAPPTAGAAPPVAHPPFVPQLVTDISRGMRVTADALERGAARLQAWAYPLLTRLGVRREYLAAIFWVYLAIVVVVGVRLLAGVPLVGGFSHDGGGEHRRTTVHRTVHRTATTLGGDTPTPGDVDPHGASSGGFQLGSSIYASMVLTIGLNALLYFLQRRGGAAAR